ncbi:MAG: T9SS type A sorting domain-containing protein, partial [Candidatus Marinimicrobia bacterium]|nr:T9SS type A sorting domain-containing protein [Candidatus Neomarinimicrobiota bacterium]MCF7829358.1 T9SS type A sorting domain-containing protein [Candidatus Neomarinimicrobiota bacterium]MCF7879979.1 T9SS type A sorting domain-containing protein [Candidatus Neomarinimicrobiota bacterium]
FLDGYKSTLPMFIQTTAYGEESYYIESGYPFGWTIAARNNADDNYKTALIREHSSGGRGVIWTYDPVNYSGAAQNLFTILLDHFSSLPINEITVEEGNIAFIAQNDNNIYSDRESALKDKLQSLGHETTYIPFGKLSKTDLSSAQFIITTEFPTINQTQIDSFMSDGKHLILLYNSASVLGGQWESNRYGGSGDLYIEQNDAFLADYSDGSEFEIQNSGYAYYISSAYPNNWTNIGRNTDEIINKTAFYSISSGSGKGVVFTYDYEQFSDIGNQILEKQISWLQVPSPVLTVTGKISNKFDSTQVGSNPTDDNYNFSIENNGGDELKGSITHTGDWVTISPSTISLTSEESQVIAVKAITEELTTGSYTDTIIISTNGGIATGVVEVIIYQTFPPTISNFTIQGVGNLQHVLNHNPTFTWQYNDPEGRNQDSYQLQISTQSNFNPVDIWDSGIINSLSTSEQYTGQELEDGRNYYARLQVSNSDGIESEYSTISFRMNSEPTNPALLTPQDGQTISSRTPILTLSNSEDAQNDELEYKFYISTNAQFTFGLDSSSFISETSDSTSWDLSEQLQDNTQYWWRTRAYDGFEYSEYSVANTFTVNTTTEIEEGHGIPTEFTLAQNYPNPFNPTTNIRYGIPHSTYVKLVVYNSQGELVTLLVNREKYAGWHEVHWSGVDGAGNHVSSGVYFYYLYTENYVDIGKMVYMK